MASSWWHWLECWQWHVLHYRDVWGVQSSGGPLPSLPRGLLVIGKCLQIKLPLNIVITRVWAGADDWSHQMNVWQCLTSDHQLGWGLIGRHRVIYCSYQVTGVTCNTGEYREQGFLIPCCGYCNKNCEWCVMINSHLKLQNTMFHF